ncbi:MAG: ester cyclase [Candidatus Protistobacter heckmanni]|nr:ester cyclase [Candidatus Protistobacter heckmanni]
MHINTALPKLAAALAAATLLSAPAWAAPSTNVEANKKAVTAFYETGFNKKSFEEAEKYMGARYIQHNPEARDGKEGLKEFIEYMRKKTPEAHNTIKRIVAEGDLVAVFVHSVPKPGERGIAKMDIYRLEDDAKIVEHWDVVQKVPKHPKNDNGMF